MRSPVQGRRFHARIPAVFEVGAWRADGEIRNLGQSGVFVRTPTIPRRGEKVWLRFTAPGGEPVEATGLVWWTTLDPLNAARRTGAPGFGVRLVQTSRSYRRMLRRLGA